MIAVRELHVKVTDLLWNNVHRLIAESIKSGVSHMRVFAEVDHTVRFKCLDAAIKLKKLFASCCEIQVCAFAQDPIISGPHCDTNRQLFLEAMARSEVEVLGTTPYVEDSICNVLSNIHFAVKTANFARKHLDLHLDYNIDPKKQSIVHEVLGAAECVNWRRTITNKGIALGHCTRLTLFSRQEWEDLAKRIRDNDTPISFIGLPTSDLFIQGKPSDKSGGGERPRGTLQIPHMKQQYGLEGAIAINNVGNAFTPQGSCDPLALASWGVGIYQAGTKAGVECLFDCVSSDAKRAIGFDGDPRIVKRGKANFTVFGGGDEGTVKLSGQRPRLGLLDLVYDPPMGRRVVHNGCLVET